MCVFCVVSHIETTALLRSPGGVFAFMSLHSNTIKQRELKKKKYQPIVQPLKAQAPNRKDKKN